MEIKAAIKQKSFRSNKEKLLINLLYTSNWIRDHHNNIFKKHGILGQHYNVLRIVNGSHPNPVSPGYIIEVMLDKKRDLTRLVDKLVRLKYLERKVSEINRRMVDINITPKGKEVVLEIKDKIDIWLNQYMNLKEDEADHISNMLDKLRQ